MFSYLGWSPFSSYYQTSPVQELGNVIKGTFGSAQEQAKIAQLHKTMAKIQEFEGKATNGLRGQFEMAKALSGQEYKVRVQDLASLNGHSLDILMNYEKKRTEFEMSSFDESFQFIRNNFDLIVKAQTLSIENSEAYNNELKTLDADVAKSVNALVQLNLKAMAKESLSTNYYKTAKELENEFCILEDLEKNEKEFELTQKKSSEKTEKTLKKMVVENLFEEFVDGIIGTIQIDGKVSGQL